MANLLFKSMFPMKSTHRLSPGWPELQTKSNHDEWDKYWVVKINRIDYGSRKRHLAAAKGDYERIISKS